MIQVIPSPGVELRPFHQDTKDRDVSSFSPRAPSLLNNHFLPAPSPKTSDAKDMIDIRSSDTSLLDTLDTQTLSSLLQPPGKKSFPSLLLWDEKGQSLYDDILATPHYYPYRVENALLQKQISHIASTISSSTTDIIVELGAGNLSKTALLLSALDRCLDSSSSSSKPIVYYALDVDQSLLESSLRQLRIRTNLQHIKLRSLLGTYEDGARWLSQPDLAPYRKTMVWLGNSIANYEKEEASALLTKFTTSTSSSQPHGMMQIQNLAGFLLGVDGCLDKDKVEKAYDAPGGENRRWILHALEAARSQLGLGLEDSESMFDEKHWRFEGRWHSKRQRYDTYLVPLKKLEATIRGQKVVLEEGEEVFVLGSGKWTAKDVQEICEDDEGPGLRLRRSWHSDEDDYGKCTQLVCRFTDFDCVVMTTNRTNDDTNYLTGIYWLQPGKKRVDSGIEMEDGDEE